VPRAAECKKQKAWPDGSPRKVKCWIQHFAWREGLQARSAHDHLPRIPMIAKQIDEILAARQRALPQIQNLCEWLNQFENALHRFGDVADDLKSSLKNQEADETARLDGLRAQIPGLHASLSERRTELERLRTRLHRETLNIGVVGRAGQGKSTLLQALTGLDGDVIPSAKKGHCTGAASALVNREGEVEGRIEFHSERTFLQEVIGPFVAELGLGVIPRSLGDLKQMNCDPLPGFSADQKTKLDRLKLYRDHVSDYGDRLGTKPATGVESNKIREFVAQQTATGTPLYNWIAVRKAEILCPFPIREVGKVALLDTPGLGDFVVGAEERLIQTVASNLDFIVFVRMSETVKQRGLEPADTQLYDVISRALSDVPLDLWSWFIVNQAGDRDLADYLADQVRKHSEFHIRTAGVEIVDCSAKDQANEALAKILKYLVASIGKIDSHYLKACEERLGQLAQAVMGLCESAKSAVPAAAGRGGDRALLNKLFDEVWVEVSDGLVGLLENRKDNRDEPDKNFEEEVDRVFAELEANPPLPDEQTIAKVAKGPGLMKWQADKFHDMRTAMSKALGKLDKVLTKDMDEIRSSTERVLAERGLLAKLNLQSGHDFWSKLADLWLMQADGRDLWAIIQDFGGAEISVKGFIQHRIRPELDVLDSGSEKAEDYVFEARDNSARVREKLVLAWEEALAKAKDALMKLSNEPNQAKFALLEDFVDGVLRFGGQSRAHSLWGNFYWQERATIWPDQFGALQDQTRLRQRWDDAIRIIKELVARLEK
jgi:hypothetical protein